MAISGVSSSGIAFTGLATGIDTDQLIEKLLGPQRVRVAEFQVQQAEITEKQTTFSALEASLLDLQTQAANLGRTFTGAFDGRKVTSSDDALVKAAASSTANAGTYSIKVNSLAQAAQVSTATGFAEPNTDIKTGTLGITVGSGSTTTVTINSGNNTLQGLVDAINSSGADVTASIVNDGSGATPFRLMLTSKKLGDINDIVLTNNLSGGTGSAVAITQTVQEAKDAEIVLGSTTPITVKSSSNTIENAIAGVTLNLQGADSSKTISLSVTNDTDKAKQSVVNFVNSYNAVIGFIDERDNFDSTTNTGGMFLGDSNVSELQAALENVVGSSVSGANPLANRLSAVGVTFTDSGRLSIDSGKLDRALTGQLSGVSLDDVKKLFAFTGSSSNPGVSFVVGSTKTQTSSPVTVNLSAVAEQASIKGSAPLAGFTVSSTNKELKLTLGGRTGTIQLTEGTFTAAQIAADIQSKVNASDQFGGFRVSAGLDTGGELKLSSQGFGSAVEIKVESGTGTLLTDLNLTAGQNDKGVDVAGTFVVNGVTQTATGSGRSLVASDSGPVAGLQVAVNLNALPGTAPTLNLTRGLGSKLDETISTFTAAGTGKLKTLNDSFNQQIDDMKATIQRQEELIAAREESLVLKFAAMEATISQLTTIGNQLSAQLASLGSLVPKK